MIGSLGDLIFNASANQFKTFNSVDVSSNTRFGTHDTIDGKPRLEFTGEDLDSISLKLFWRVEDNVNPLREIEILQNARREGKVLPFLIGGKKVGSTGMYVITSISQRPSRIDNRGNSLAVEFNVSLKEYYSVNPTERQKESNSKTVAKNPTQIVKENITKGIEAVKVSIKNLLK